MCTIGINYQSDETSDWALSEILIWDDELDEGDLLLMMHNLLMSVNPCSGGYFVTHLGGICNACPAGSALLLDASSDDLIGHYGDFHTCTYCGGNTYSTTSTSSSCSTCPSDTAAIIGGKVCCPAGKYNIYNSDQCLSCPSGSTSSAGSSVCTCSYGYFQIAVGRSSCPDGYTYYPEIERCFKYDSTSKSSWGEAQYTCSIDSNGWLPTISSEDIDDVLHGIATDKNKHLWIGLHCMDCTSSERDTNTDWKWIRGGNTSQYHNWNSLGDVDARSCAYVRRQSAGGWNTHYCTSKLKYVCETEVIIGQPHCGIKTDNYVLIMKDTDALGSDYGNGFQINEIDVYEGDTKLDKATLTFSMSSIQAGTNPSNCNDNQYGDNNYCQTDSDDSKAFLIIHTESNFDKVVVYQRGNQFLLGSSIKFYHGETVVFTSIFSTAAASYTFLNWNGGNPILK